ncbi:MAG TPA: thioredoxin-dependent thiol peroxidase [Elusimicrobiota bacterium]|nr:thioredoxin-dependent thiol peroxidase [Elusimicrobiota bacterium]
MLEIGDKAPAFTALDQDGKKVSLSDFKGKQVVLYFYPKDMTPGCTVEACAFRDGHGALQKAGAVVLGVSKDPVPSHKKFSDKFSLPFSLLADEDLKIMKAYGAWGEKSLYGRKFMGTLRVTYIINSNGKIKAVFKKVKPAGHDREILALL